MGVPWHRGFANEPLADIDEQQRLVEAVMTRLMEARELQVAYE
jgi:hypothetical protein